MGVLETLGPGLLGGAMSAIGSLGTSYMNWQSQKETNELAEELSNTAIQRRVADMKAAGLNPVLAAGNPASQPPITAPHMEDPLAAAMKGADQAQSLALTAEQQRLTRNQADKAAAEREGVALDNQLKTNILGARTAQENAAAEYAVRTLESRVSQTFNESQIKEATAYIQQVQAEWTQQLVDPTLKAAGVNPLKLQADYLAARKAAVNQGIEQSKADIASMAFAIQKSGMDAEMLRKLGIPPMLLDLLVPALEALGKIAF